MMGRGFGLDPWAELNGGSAVQSELGCLGCLWCLSRRSQTKLGGARDGRLHGHHDRVHDS